MSIILDGFDEWGVGRFERAERIAIRHDAFILAIAESLAEGDGLFFRITSRSPNLIGEFTIKFGIKPYFFEIKSMLRNFF